MNVLVVGGTRFSGVHLVNFLVRAGHNVTVANRGNNSDVFGESVTRIRCDRTDPESVKNALFGQEFDVVYDNAAYCSMDVRCLLENVGCGKYIMMSTGSVYKELHMNLLESEFDPSTYKLTWCDRVYADYSEVKRQAECAVVQAFPQVQSTLVRFPYIVGVDDYTERLYLYVKNIVDGIAMNIDNLDCEIPFITSSEVGRFLSSLADKPALGAVNAACRGTVSPRRILDNTNEITGKAAVLDKNGAAMPYNGSGSFSMNTEKSSFRFSSAEIELMSLIGIYAVKAQIK